LQEPFINISTPKIDRDYSLYRTYVIFRTLGLRHLTVVDGRNRVVGIITRKDLMQFRIQERLESLLQLNNVMTNENTMGNGNTALIDSNNNMTTDGEPDKTPSMSSVNPDGTLSHKHSMEDEMFGTLRNAPQSDATLNIDRQTKSWADGRTSADSSPEKESDRKVEEDYNNNAMARDTQQIAYQPIILNAKNPCDRSTVQTTENRRQPGDNDTGLETPL